MKVPIQIEGILTPLLNLKLSSSKSLFSLSNADDNDESLPFSTASDENQLSNYDLLTLTKCQKI